MTRQVATTNGAAGYSLQNAQEFGWNSLTGELLPERRWLLDTYVTGSTVLDAGCGGGGFVDYLCKRGFDATGLERHAMFLDVARQRGFSGAFVNGDLTAPLPFADGAFDTTICLDVLEHVSDDAAAVRELMRVTRRRLVVAVPHQDTWMPSYRLIFYPYRDPTHLRYYTRETLDAILQTPRASEITVFGEQPILLQHLALDQLHPESKYPGVTRIYQRVFRFLVEHAGQHQLFMNLAAVVNLRDDGVTACA
jgi:SAM-dependent methyltransferase